MDSLSNYQLQIANYKFLPNPFPSHVQFLGQHSCFADDAGEIRVRDPAWQNVHVDVSGHAGACGLSDIHAEIDAVGPIQRPQHRLHPLGQNYHLVGSIGGEPL